MFENLSFENPYILLLILPFIIFHIYFKTQAISYYIPHFYETMPHTNQKNHIKSVLKWLMLISSLIALSSPITMNGKKLQENKSIDIVLALDTSGSMSMTGFNPLNYEQSRWSVVQDVVKDFIKKREHDRVGLVVFGTSTSVASALSYSKLVQLNIIDGIKIGVLGKSTALIDGLTSSVNLLKNSKKSSKVIVLLSDGEDTSSKTPLSIALKFAKKHNVRIYTVNIDKTNSNTLKLISQENNAKSFHANNKEDLYEIYKTIDTLERSTIADKNMNMIKYYSFYFISFSLICSFLLLAMIHPREKI